MDYLTDREIDRKVLDLVARTRRSHCIPPGTGAKEACERLGLSLEFRALPLDKDGMRVGRHIVVNRVGRWLPRIQFTTYHEVMHFLVDEDGELIEYFTEVFRDNPVAYARAVERCCNIGAAEFLLPRESIRRAIDTEGLSVDQVTRVADVHGSSIVAAAVQVAACAPVECYVAICAHGPIPRGYPPRSGLYLEYAIASRSVRYPVARFTPVPEEHLLQRAWETGQRVEGWSYVPFRSGKKMKCYCEGLPLGGRVVAILFVERPVPVIQAGLPLGW